MAKILDLARNRKKIYVHFQSRDKSSTSILIPMTRQQWKIQITPFMPDARFI